MLVYCMSTRGASGKGEKLLGMFEKGCGVCCVLECSWARVRVREDAVGVKIGASCESCSGSCSSIRSRTETVLMNDSMIHGARVPSVVDLI